MLELQKSDQLVSPAFTCENGLARPKQAPISWRLLAAITSSGLETCTVGHLTRLFCAQTRLVLHLVSLLIARMSDLLCG